MFIVSGGNRLQGTVKLSGAKNSVLPILAASLINRGESLIENCPDLSDVQASIEILRHLGCVVKKEGKTIYIDSGPMSRCDIPDELMRKMRSSVIFLGPILACAGCVDMFMPGGCELGSRPIDIHLAAMRKMGAYVDDSGGAVKCRAERLKGAEINLSFPSVGATENIMLAACLAEGDTVITNAACEPEIEDLQTYLQAMGADVTGAGTSTVVIKGKRELHNAVHSVVPDRIVAATYMSAVCSAGGEVTIENAVPAHLKAITDVLTAAGCVITELPEGIEIVSKGRPKAVPHIRTAPYPGFPTDAQAPVMAALLKAKGTSVFVETIFENRFRHVGELMRMGADIRTEGRAAVVFGVESLGGAVMECTDLRGGAALVAAALGAEGESRITGLKHIDRGYDSLEKDLKNIGAAIKRVEI